ncbi:hypothetical protein [Kitasatospora azatica]|uniref:hypothetical protein n=1 Tax=Kitasatospora azatica TaxID=58347 RepID=UPI00056ADA55|nr:hypothetical protein [Kitasatospora azatica]
MALMRTEYTNLSTGTVRSGPTGHGESLDDMESFLLPMEQLRAAALYGWGVASGLQVSATLGQPGLTVATGCALDAAGHTVVLAAGSVAVVDPNADPNQQQNIPTVPVGANGVQLGSAGLTGDQLLTLTWREVISPDSPSLLLHAPWLRLVAAAGFQDLGQQLVLAEATLDATGNITALLPGLRRAVSLATGRLALRTPQPVTGPGVGELPVTELAPRGDGGLDIDLVTGGGSGRRPALTIQGATGNLGIGIGSAPAQRIVHVEGSEVHSGGGGGGFSFADRAVETLVDQPGSGERWVWYAANGVARLWSGDDKLTVGVSGEGGGLDVSRRMRVRQGADASAGIWFHQSDIDQDCAFVGMASDTSVGFYGTGIGWGLQMDSNSGALTFSSDYGTPNGPSTLSLWASRIGDVGNGVLFLRSGGNVVAVEKDFVGIGTTTPSSRLQVVADSGNAIEVGGGGTGVIADGSNYGVVATSPNDGIFAIGSNNAGVFWGNVYVSGAISKPGGGFKIDHPLDPANQYLSHSFVESPEMLNLYNGTAVIGPDGEVTVELPDWFAALNRDFCYQLTPIGDTAQLSVAREVRDDSFTIRSDKPGIRVSWQLTGVRQDPWANANRIPVAEPKPEQERDRYLHPEVHDQPIERHVWAPLVGDRLAGLR